MYIKIHYIFVCINTQVFTVFFNFYVLVNILYNRSKPNCFCLALDRKDVFHDY